MATQFPGYFPQITDAALQRIDDIAAQADVWATQTLTQMQTLSTTAESLLTILDGIVYNPSFSGLDLTYVGPGVPTEPDYSAEVGVAPTLATLSTSLTSPAASLTAPAATLGNTSATLATLNTTLATLDTIPSVTAFSNAESSYTELVQTEMQTKLQSVLGDNLVVSAATWTAIHDRAVEIITQQQVGEEWAASNLGASKGWVLPSESTLARVDAANDNTSENVAKQAVDQSIQEALQRRDDLWKATQAANPFEQIWQQHHNNVENRSLARAIQIVAQAIAINQLLISKNAQTIAQDAQNLKQDDQTIEQDSQRLKQDDQVLSKNEQLLKEDDLQLRYNENKLRVDDLALRLNDQNIKQDDQIIAQDNQKIQLFLTEWDAVLRRIQATAQMLNARTGAEQLKVNSESSRLGYENALIGKDTKVADGVTQLAVDRARLVVENSLGTLSKIAELITGVTQALLAASDVSVGTGTSIGVTEQHYYDET